MKKQYLIHPQVRDEASKLHSRGGKYAKAAGQVTHIINEISRGSDDPFKGIPQTNNGESRIDNCVKYDLTGFCRLVTVIQKNKVFLLFVGGHEDVDKWLKSHKGAVFAERDGMPEIIPMPSRDGQPELLGEAVYSKGTLCDQISDRHVDYVLSGFPSSIVKKILNLGSMSGENAILDIYEDLQGFDNADLFFDVFIALMCGRRDEALKRIDFHKGEYKDLTLDPLVSGEVIQVIPDDDPTYGVLFEHFVKTADYKQWMLFMHPLQQEMVDIDYKGSGKLLGVSGSGKTCVLVKRAVRLARKYPDEKILLVTLNRSLANLINELVDTVADQVTRSQIVVRPFFILCQEYLREYEPDSEKLYDDVTWKSLEHIDEIWQEFYRCENNNHSASVLWPVHDYLISQGINAGVYIREEFDWIRSAISPDAREKYLEVERQGRSVPLMQNHRRLLLDGLKYWEEKMYAVGVTDYLGLATALYGHVDKLYPIYRSVLVDESQDFGTTELTILRRICKEGENDIFLCGDAAQRVSTKFQSLRESGISIPSSSSRKIVKNYRNSKEILEAAYAVLSNNIPDGASRTEDFEVLDPDFSNRSGSVPLLMHSASLSDEVSNAMHFVQSELEGNPSWKACIAFCGYSAYEILRFGEQNGVRVLDNNARLSEASLFFSDLEQTKGFEFDLIVIVNASKDVIPYPRSDERERLRYLTQFYVALTRAKIQLVVSYSGERSVFLEGVNDYFLEAQWSDYNDGEVCLQNVPVLIDLLREHSDFPTSAVFMSGHQFLYTDAAIGIDPLLIEKLRNLISGVGRTRGRGFIEWRNLGSAHDSCRNDVKARQVFGPEGRRLFMRLCEDLGIVDEMKALKKEDVYKGIAHSGPS